MKSLFKPKIPGAPASQGPVTRDDAREAADRDEEMRKRRGGAADMITGAIGAEAGATGKTQLG